MNAGERFCSRCGTDSAVKSAPSSAPPPMTRGLAVRDWDMHVKVLGWTFIISAMLMAVPGLSLMMFPGMMRMTHMIPPMPLLGPLYLMIMLMFLSIPAGIAFTGIGLLKYKDWSRVVATILAIFMLLGFPFFTAIGVYALWVLNSREGSQSYKLRSA
jgi:hypothetical protein